MSSGFSGAAGKGGERAARRTVLEGTDERRSHGTLPPAASGGGEAGPSPARADAGEKREVPLDILLLGPQGAGKGTQGKLISREYGIPHIATGDILRAAIAAGTELGLKAEPILTSGQLVPDGLMIGLIRDRLAREDTERGFVLDGFPRTAVQAAALDEMLGEIDRPLSVVFEFQLPEEMAVERLHRRAQEEGRADDTAEAIRTRLSLYHEQTAPLVEYYRARGILVPVHADRSVDEVFEEIQQALEQVAVR